VLEIPSSKVSEWLTGLAGSIFDAYRFKEASARTGGFKDPAFLDRMDTLSSTVDELVYDTSFLKDLESIRARLDAAPPEVMDCLIARFLFVTAELAQGAGNLKFPSGKPDILAAYRLFLIRDERVRNKPRPDC
jgi:hypothetical protein